MKNKFFLLCSSLLFATFLMAQKDNKLATSLRKFNNDTATYVRQYILAHKDSYIGKPLDSLLKDLPVIVDYLNGDIPRNRFVCPNTTLCFASYRDRTAKLTRKEFPNIVTVTWATPLDNKELPILGLGIWGGTWTQAAYNYYKNKIVGDIGEIRL